MCAICGIVNFSAADHVEAALLGEMAATLAHRGPDDEGYFLDGQVGLGHRRLSIIDLGGGKQPIFNEDRSAVIIFNGEIYNFLDLRPKLTAAGHSFATRSDTETILHAYEEYGDDCVDYLRGMFAFAIWDRRRRRLLLARDRLGVKPLYYFLGSRFLAFASEIKALLAIPSVSREVDPEALDLYFSLRYVPGPRTLFRNILRLQPGHLLVLDENGVRIRKYWDIQYQEPDGAPPSALLKRFEELLEESVRLRLIAEVPLGVFLSGGLDSSAVLATMSRTAGDNELKTFSIGYEAAGAEEDEANELPYARLAAGAFAADHHEFLASATDFEDFLPSLIWHLDEPLADSSCIPLYFISRQAREYVTVVLSGEGADEILAGYGIYPRMLALDRAYRWDPAWAARLSSWVANLTPWEVVRRYARLCGVPFEARYRGVSFGLNPEVRHRLLGEERVQLADQLLDGIFGDYFRSASNTSILNRMLYADAKVWLPDDLLVKADKMTMANGLELRVPFLDHKLVEFAATLPVDLKLNGNGKVLLRQAMRGRLPEPILRRSKKGFPTPIAPWLRSSLAGFARQVLLSPDSASARFLDRRGIEQILLEHERRRAERSADIWTLLVFELWHSVFIDRRLRPAAASAAPLLGSEAAMPGGSCHDRRERHHLL